MSIKLSSFAKKRKYTSLVAATCLSLGMVGGASAADADIINTIPLYAPSPGFAFQNILTVPLFRTNDESLHTGILEMNWDTGQFKILKNQPIDQFSDAYKADPAFPKDLAKNLAAYVDELVGDETGGLGKTGGIVIRVDQGENSWRGAKGYSQIDECCKEHRVFTNKFRIASVTKLYTGSLVMDLVERGLIKLDDTLEDWFDNEAWYKEVPDTTITVEDLLGMKSGLVDYTQSAEILKVMACDPLKVYTPERLIQIGFEETEATKSTEYYIPKGEYNYVNTNYILLGLLIEKATGKSGLLEQIMGDKISKPLGLFNTALPETSAIPYYYDKGYTFTFMDSEDKACVVDRSSFPIVKSTMPEFMPDRLISEATYLSPTWLWTTGGMLATVDELLEATKAQIKGEVPPLSQDTLDKRYESKIEVFSKEMLSGFTGCNGDLYYGLAVMKHRGYFGHDGEIAGYNSATFYNPETDTAISLNVNNYPGIELDWQALNVMMNVVNVIEEGKPCRSPIPPATRRATVRNDAEAFTKVKLSIPDGKKKAF